jgi:hypothetical protein
VKSFQTPAFRRPKSDHYESSHTSTKYYKRENLDKSNVGVNHEPTYFDVPLSAKNGQLASGTAFCEIMPGFGCKITAYDIVVSEKRVDNSNRPMR